MKSIFPNAINGDLQLVHLSNGFRMVDGARPLHAGDVCRSEARIVSVVNSNEGKIVKVKSLSSKFSCPSCVVVDLRIMIQNTFEITEEPEYLLHLDTDAAVGVLQSRVV